MKRIDGPAISTSPQRPLVALLEGPAFDPQGYQRARRVNGCTACPDCGLLWPWVQEVEAWTRADDSTRWFATEWDLGTAFCEECEIALVGGFDHDYVIRTKERDRDPCPAT